MNTKLVHRMKILVDLWAMRMPLKVKEVVLNISNIDVIYLDAGQGVRKVEVSFYDGMTPAGQRVFMYVTGNLSVTKRLQSQLITEKQMDCRFELTHWLELPSLRRYGACEGTPPTFGGIATLVVRVPSRH